MSTKKQIAANRRNAAHCTGPTSPAGKATCSLNALRHGFYSSTVVLPGENQAAFDEMLHGLQDFYQPQDPQQQQMVDELAALKWKLYRAELFESGLLIEYGDQPASTCLAQYDRVTQIGCRLRRMMFKLYKDLAAIRAARPSESLNTSSKCCVPNRPHIVPQPPTPASEIPPLPADNITPIDQKPQPNSIKNTNTA
ncbi:MAG: hypothetical protein ABSH50_08205 [Bryobacteraceae bacterium]|jgi:hypothetical protein